MHALLLSLPFALTAPAPPSGGDGSPPQVPPTPPSVLWWGDFDADGLEDAWVVEPDGSGRLVRGAGEGQFEDVTDRVGLAGQGGVHMASWGDADGDGDLDLYLASWSGSSRLFLQDEGTFRDGTEAAGLPPHAAPLSAAWRDVDGDGALDLHLVTEVDELVYANDGTGTFQRIDLGLAPRMPAVPATRAGDPARTAASDAATGGGGSGHTPMSGPGFEPICSQGVTDQSGGTGCIPASTVGTLGHLYPLSNDLFVDSGTGRVGVGTTSPSQRLHVIGNVRSSGNLIGSQGVFSANPPLDVSGSALVNNLNADMLDGLHASAFATLPVTGADVADGTIGAADLGAGSVGASELQAGAITDVHVDASAGIAGTKISPAFGSQAVTGGTFDAGYGTPSSPTYFFNSIEPTGLSSPYFNQLHLITNGVTRMEFQSSEDIYAHARLSVDDTSDGYFDVRGGASSAGFSGYLSVGGVGGTNFDGYPTLDPGGNEIGVLGVSMDEAQTDNYGVFGHSNGVGVRGEFSDEPTSTYGELGTEEGHGVRGEWARSWAATSPAPTA